ncbi:MAG: hypothetical protein ACOY94_26225 [Bacillota bacterium]
MIGKRCSWIPLFLSLAASLSLLATPISTAYAAGDREIIIQEMTIDLRPEYDTSDVLIIYDFSLTNTGKTPYTAEVSFHVPKGATNQVHICEQVGTDKHALCRPYKTEETGDSTLMTWKPSKPIEPGQSYPIYVEYYYNPIQGAAEKRIDFLYHPSYTVENLRMSVTQPLRSSDWTLHPAPASTGGAGDGMTRYYYSWKNVDEGKPVSLAITYTKADNKPSVAKKATDLSVASGLSTEAKVAIGVVIAALFGGLLYLGLRRGPGGKPGKRAAAPVRPAPVVPPPRAKHGPHTTPQPPPPAPRKPLTIVEQRRQARQMLLEGRISEATYHEIIHDLDADAGGSR